ncbi:hypothetical protein CAL7716_001160 [Calothrix sp. PCC 7716]|nr:hypothetical protein CAL7716_001160 [Calothrix sp. PCC 7716]
MNVLLKLIFPVSLIMLIISGCSTSSSNTQNAIASNTSSNQCPDKPIGSLDIKNVKQIQLSSQNLRESGQVRASEDVGYVFEAKSGQRLNRESEQDICIWVYAPDNQIITTKDLSKTGKYTIQISALKGSTTFDLKLSLEDLSTSTTSNQTNPIPTTSVTSNTTTTSNTSTSEHPAADNFVKNHYKAIQNRQYNSSYNNLSSQFIKDNLKNGYSEYQKWWDSVRELQIGNIVLINQNNYKAIVNADLSYTMKDGRTIKDSNNRISLVWSSNTKQWLIDQKIKNKF